MNCDLEQVEVSWGERRILAELRRTHRRVLRVEVRPAGNVVVIAPSGVEIETIQHRVKRKCPWIFRELDRIASRPAVTPARHFVSGETHLLLGKPYRLSVEPRDRPEVRIDGTRLRLLTPQPGDSSACRELMKAFYTSTARTVFRERLDAMAPPFLRKGMTFPSLMILAMSKRWGSYTTNGRIVLNVDLVRASPSLIDYVICHELTHGFYGDHGKEWKSLLSTVMPDWEIRKARLETLLR